MRFANPFVRSFLAGIVWHLIVAIKIAHRNSYNPGSFPPRLVIILLVAWIITALLVGRLAGKVKAFRSWPGNIAATVVGSIAVMGLMLLTTQINSETQPKLPTFESTDQMMAYFANEATQWMKKEKGVDLDYSVGSIKNVEEELGVIAREVNKQKPQPGTFGIAMGYGAYIGEVFRRQNGGAWTTDDAIGGQNSYPLKTGGNTVYPVMWCYKRLINGDEDNVYFKALAFKKVAADGTNQAKFQPTKSSTPAKQTTN